MRFRRTFNPVSSFSRRRSQSFALVTGSKRVATAINTAAYPESGVSLTYFGEAIQLYAADAASLGVISGSVTIEAEEYLDPL